MLKAEQCAYQPVGKKHLYLEHNYSLGLLSVSVKIRSLRMLPIRAITKGDTLAQSWPSGTFPHQRTCLCWIVQREEHWVTALLNPIQVLVLLSERAIFCQASRMALVNSSLGAVSG